MSGPRYAPAERLLRLARLLAGTRVGLTIEEIAAALHVSRRSAERLRAGVEAVFPEMTSRQDSDRLRRWWLPGPALLGLRAPPVEVVSAIEVAAREHETRGDTERADLLRDGAAALRTLVAPTALAKAETSIGALMEAEGIALRPGPRPQIAKGVLPVLRRAILGMQLVRLSYRAQGATTAVERLVCPYGILYGGHGWLVAHVDGLPDMRLWRLDRIIAVELLDRLFPRREDFSLSDYVARSFGIFQEEPVDVVLRFTPEAAEDAAGWLFHPTQTMEPQTDGALIVRFRAGGMLEMCWHLFTWGNGVEILGPETLKFTMNRILRQ